MSKLQPRDHRGMSAMQDATQSRRDMLWATGALAVGSGLLSVAFGIFIVYKMGYVNGIFTSHPKWTPE